MSSIAALLVRRRQVWLPTLWGWLLLLLVVGSASIAAGRQADRWLAVDAPARGADGRGARTLVVEGWLDPRQLDAASRVFAAGRYERLVTTGGPNHEWPESVPPRSYADRAAEYLIRHGVPAAKVIVASAPASARDRTFLSAVMVREWGRHSATPLTSVDVFTAGVHARRSRMLYRAALGPGVEVGVLPAGHAGYDPDRWWTSSAGVKAVIGETLSVAWTACCFWPPLPTSLDDRWGAGP